MSYDSTYDDFNVRNDLVYFVACHNLRTFYEGPQTQLLLLKKPTQNTEHERPETAKHQVRVQSVQEI